MRQVQPEKRRVKPLNKKSIARRWFVNILSVIVIALIISIFFFSFFMQSYVYNGVEQALVGRSDELINVFSSSSSYETSAEFNAVCRSYIENFPDKNDMEIMSVSATGKILVTSTGFAPDQSQSMPDYDEALSSDSGFGRWVGTLNTGEKAMAITRVVRNSFDTVLGSVRYLVSMEKADNQVAVIVGGLITVGCLIIMFVILSGFYFIRSIVGPIKQLNIAAREIASGDFNARIAKKKNDEIGQLIDTINDMAAELGTSETMKNDFISSVSHELRTPLTAIKGWAETLHEGGTDDETFGKGMNVIIRESERLSGLVEELLDFSRIQNGKLLLNMAKTDILSELDEAVYMFTDRARTEGKSLVYEETPSLPPVTGDVNRLRQVFVNIIDNALKYTTSGGRIAVSSYVKDGYVNVVISDNGCGISEKDLPNIKKKFYKANQLVRGSGIGLAVANEIVSLHSGYLNVESKLGAGTKVTIGIPVCQ